jgi:hypothetical protein
MEEDNKYQVNIVKSNYTNITEPSEMAKERAPRRNK